MAWPTKLDVSDSPQFMIKWVIPYGSSSVPAQNREKCLGLGLVVPFLLDYEDSRVRAEMLGLSGIRMEMEYDFIIEV